jgi:hypothetical protein
MVPTSTPAVREGEESDVVLVTARAADGIPSARDGQD